MKKTGDKNRSANTKQSRGGYDSRLARRRGKQSFQQLASYRLHQLTTLSERFIGMRYRHKFGLRMLEVGILITVGDLDR